MGQKTQPVGFRLQLTKNWKSVWHDDKRFKDLLHEDIKLRDFLRDKLKSAGLARAGIKRKINETEITLHVAKPGLVIGRGGANIERLREGLNRLTEGKLKLDVIEVKKPMLSARLVAEMIVGQVVRRYPYKRAVNQAIDKVMEAGALGVKVVVSGVLSGPRSISRTEKYARGSVPTSTLKADVDFCQETAVTGYGTIGVKVWVYRSQS